MTKLTITKGDRQDLVHEVEFCEHPLDEIDSVISIMDADFQENRGGSVDHIKMEYEKNVTRSKNEYVDELHVKLASGRRVQNYSVCITHPKEEGEKTEASVMHKWRRLQIRSEFIKKMQLTLETLYSIVLEPMKYIGYKDEQFQNQLKDSIPTLEVDTPEAMVTPLQQ